VYDYENTQPKLENAMAGKGGAEGIAGAVSTVLAPIPYAAVGAVLLLAGAAVVVVGAAGGVMGWIMVTDSLGQWIIIGLGLVICAFGAWLLLFKRAMSVSTLTGTYGLHFTVPDTNASVNEVDTIRGRFEEDWPESHRLYVLRYYPDDSYYPMPAAVNRRDKSWDLEKVNLGTSKGPRRLVACLIGPDGQKLIDYFVEARDVHRRLRDEYVRIAHKSVPYAPNLSKRTSDMHECALVKVTRV
jgi:hypothetical protein